MNPRSRNEGEEELNSVITSFASVGTRLNPPRNYTDHASELPEHLSTNSSLLAGAARGLRCSGRQASALLDIGGSPETEQERP